LSWLFAGDALRAQAIVAAQIAVEAQTTAATQTAAEAQTAVATQGNRPRIGLVLSGGGARGVAHIGVLKVIDDLRIPIDAIAGTSMGAVVGGLYASGLSAREIEAIVTSLNWQDAFRDTPPRRDLTFRRKLEDQNFLVKFPLGLRAGRFQLPKGLIQGQKLNQALRRLTLPVAGIEAFDDLPIRFRAVATDLETGDAVIMSHGDLTSAMRASLSAPGVFSPVEREGRLLVDGGLSENLPADVVRAMNVDVLIVVDVGAPLADRSRLTSVPAISNQMLAILISRDSKRQRALLGADDVIIDPPLADASSFDFGNVKRVINAGEKAARESQSRLSVFSVDAATFGQYVARKDAARGKLPRIEFVKVAQGSEEYAEPLRRIFKDVVGKPLDPEHLAERVTGYYGRGNLEALDYELVTDEQGREGLSLQARRNSWGPNYVRFGLNLQDDFAGNSSYNAAARFVLSEFTKPGGEWVWDVQIGETSRLASELYLPLWLGSPYFVSPHVQFGARNVDVIDEQTRVAQYRVRSFDYGIDAGREFGNWGEVRAGILRSQGRSRVRIGDPTLVTGKFDVETTFARLAYDELDDVNFPRHGTLASVEWRSEDPKNEIGDSSDQLIFDWLSARSFGRNTAVIWSSYGTTLNEDETDVRQLFPLGGFLNLSGLKSQSLSGTHYGIARFMFYRQIGRGGPGFLDVPAYLGFSLEAGNVWDHRDDISFGSARKDASLFLGFDTLLGPVYVATGFEEGGPNALYLFLGRTF
jgi:NTE family protein